MAYDSNNRRLYVDAANNRGITIQEVDECLRLNGVYDLGSLCTSAKINKWARCKPIGYPSFNPLTDEQRKGSAEANGKGIYYGIEVKVKDWESPLDNITLFGNLEKVHDVEFVYHPPQGIAFNEPFRLRDFDGYSHLATPNPYASIPMKGYYNDKQTNGMGINSIACLFRNGDTSGVNMLDRLVGVTEEDTLRHAFPAIVITTQSGKTYFTALTYEDGTYRPILTDRGYATGYWSVTMSKPMREGTRDIDSPFDKAEVVTASVVVIKSTSTDAPMLTAGGTINDNFGTYWIDSSEDRVAVHPQPFILAGDANGVLVTLSQYFAGIVFAPTSVRRDTIGTTLNFTIQMAEVTGASSTNDIELMVTITLSNGDSRSTTLRLSGHANGGIAPFASVNFPDVINDPNTKYSGEVSVRTTDGNASPSFRSLTFENL